MRLRLGLIADVHNHAAELTSALDVFRVRRVDQIVSIGDICDAFGCEDGIQDVVTLLDKYSVVGVWGNHDFTLCRNVPDRIRDRYESGVFDTMARMKPRLVIENCHFSHKESSVDPCDAAQLWDISDGPIDLMERAASAFSAVDSRWQFIGHYHRWWAATPIGPLGWTGVEPLRFKSGQRYFVVVAAVCDGWCSILDTEQRQLEPLRCGPADS